VAVNRLGWHQATQYRRGPRCDRLPAQFVNQPRTSAAIAASTPFTNRPESSVE
jgi:hypothetical protein